MGLLRLCTARCGTTAGSMLLLLCAVCPLVPCGASGVLPPTTRIAFGSCSKVDKPQPFWDILAQRAPHIWVWTGDNVYADHKSNGVYVAADEPTLSRLYTEQRAVSAYKSFREQLASARVPGHPPNLIGTWDDHDYGINDGDATYPLREQSQRLFLDFLDEAQDSERRQQQGVYAAYDYPVCLDAQSTDSNGACSTPSVLRVILLDVRFHKDPYQGEHGAGDFLGESQWKWLESKLVASPARMHVIVSGVQVLPEEGSYECWSRFPAARERLLDLIYRHNVSAPLIISGDVHMAQMLRGHCRPAAVERGAFSTLFEITSSGLTHAFAPLTSASGLTDLLQKWRVHVYHHVMPLMYKSHLPYFARNAGELEIDWPSQAVHMRILGEDGREHLAVRASLADLDPKHVSDRTRCEPHAGYPTPERVAVGLALWELGASPRVWLCVVGLWLLCGVVLERRRRRGAARPRKLD